MSSTRSFHSPSLDQDNNGGNSLAYFVLFLIGLVFAPVVTGAAIGFVMGYYQLGRERLGNPSIWPLPSSMRLWVLIPALIFFIVGFVPSMKASIIDHGLSTAIVFALFTSWQKRMKAGQIEYMRHGSASICDPR